MSTDEYRLYLPEIGSLPGQLTGDGDTTVTSPFPLLAEDILALLQDNAECKRRLTDTQRQLDQVLSRLDSLSINQSQNGRAAASASAAFPAITTTQSGVRPAVDGAGLLGSVTMPSTTSSPTAGAHSLQQSTWASATNWMGPTTTPQPGLGLQGGLPHLAAPGPRAPQPDNPGHSTHSLWASVPQIGLVSSPAASTTTMGGPSPGQQSWWSQMIARGLPTTSTSTTTTTVWSSGLPSSAMTSSSGGPTTFSTFAAGQPAYLGLQPPLGFSVLQSGHTPTLSGIPQPPTPEWRSGYGTPPWNSNAMLQDPLGGPPVNVMIDASGIKAASKKRKCLVFDLEPHLHVDNLKNATIEDVISAEISMLESMLVLGLPIANFAKHIRFLSEKARIYTGASLLKYDQAVREKAELMGPVAFLGLECLKPKGKATKDLSQSSVGKSSKNPRPRGICWKYNESRGCKRDSCQWKHECRDCSGDHSVVDCKTKK